MKRNGKIRSQAAKKISLKKSKPIKPKLHSKAAKTISKIKKSSPKNRIIVLPNEGVKFYYLYNHLKYAKYYLNEKRYLRALMTFIFGRLAAEKKIRDRDFVFGI